MVVGSRGMPGRARPVGATALEVLAALPKPIARRPARDRSETAPQAPRPARRDAFDLGRAGSGLRACGRLRARRRRPSRARRGLDPPASTTSVSTRRETWAREFVARYCPWGVGDVRLETRVGRSDEEILRAAEEFEADLIALGWAQELAPGRAPVVRAVLERGHVPVLLIPVIAATREAAVPKEEQWSSWPSLRV